jgi:ribonuclease J
VHEQATFDKVVPLIEKALAGAAAEGIGDVHQLEQLVHRTVSRWAHDTYRRSPVILPIIIDA